VRAWRTVRDPFADRFVGRLHRDVFFVWRGLLYYGQSSPACLHSPPSLRRTVRSVCRILPSLFGSFASSLVLPRVLWGIVPRTCSWSITTLSWRLVFMYDFWSCNWDIGRVFWGEFLSTPIHSPISGRLIGPSTITTTSHQSCENDCFSGPIGNFANGHQNKACYCEINIRGACGEPASLMSQRTGHVVGPTGQYW
jgi:hypothetical protein